MSLTIAWDPPLDQFVVFNIAVELVVRLRNMPLTTTQPRVHGLLCTSSAPGSGLPPQTCNIR